jgi:hypothetical protein
VGEDQGAVVSIQTYVRKPRAAHIAPNQLILTRALFKRLVLHCEKLQDELDCNLCDDCPSQRECTRSWDAIQEESGTA